jgi:type I restriction enzyme S subunit
MSDFPCGWSTKTIDEACEIHDFRRIPLSGEQRRHRKGPYPYFGANNIQDYIDDFIFDFDAVLLAEDGGYYDEHEHRDIAQYATGRYWVNNHAHILTGKTGLDTRFLYYALARKNICPWINTGTRSKLHQSDLRQIELLVPPLPEQKKIAEILSGIDSVIKTELDMASKITMQYQGILHDVFSDESSCFPLGNYLPLEELGLDISDGNYSSKYPSANEFVERGIPFIRASNMKQGTIDDNDMRFISREKHQEITKGHLKSGDILIANRGEIGKACRVPARHRGSNINAQLVRINGGKKIDQSFLYHYISSPLCQALIDELTTGTALKQLPIGNLMKLPIPVPELNVQTAIGGSLDSMQRAISALSDKSKKYSQLKQAMASDLLSGRKGVTV